MTKIDQIQPGQTGAPQGPRPSGPGQAGEVFQKVLEQAHQRAETSPPVRPQAAVPVSSYDPLAGLNGVKPPLAADALGPGQTEGLMRAERALELLEDYQHALADEKKPLKEMHGLVKALDSEVQELTQVLDKLDPQDGLYGILQEVAVTAMVQSIKFNRGDFNPA